MANGKGAAGGAGATAQGGGRLTEAQSRELGAAAERVLAASGGGLVEFSEAIDQDGRSVFGLMRGKEGHIDFNISQTAIMRQAAIDGRPIAMIHSHPLERANSGIGYSPLSGQDLRFAVLTGIGAMSSTAFEVNSRGRIVQVEYRMRTRDGRSFAENVGIPRTALSNRQEIEARTSRALPSAILRSWGRDMASVFIDTGNVATTASTVTKNLTLARPRRSRSDKVVSTTAIGRAQHSRQREKLRGIFGNRVVYERRVVRERPDVRITGTQLSRFRR